MIRIASVLSVLVLLVSASGASAQRRGSSSYSSYEPRFELIPHAGYAWTFARDALYSGFAGEFDFQDTGYWGIAGDFAMRPDKQLRLLYRRQDTEFVFRRYGGGSYKTDVAVEYWQIGGLGGVRRGNVLPYGMLTLGGTRFDPADFDEDAWKFSMIFGLGVKVYGQGRMGFMLQGSFPFTVIDGGGSISFGTGGVYTTVGGYGVGQMDLTGGLIVRF
jgi:hypothetical protein